MDGGGETRLNLAAMLSQDIRDCRDGKDTVLLVLAVLYVLPINPIPEEPMKVKAAICWEPNKPLEVKEMVQRKKDEILEGTFRVDVDEATPVSD